MVKRITLILSVIVLILAVCTSCMSGARADNPPEDPGVTKEPAALQPENVQAPADEEPATAAINMEKYIGVWEIYDGGYELLIFEADDEYIAFDLNIYRLIGLENVEAKINGSSATFNKFAESTGRTVSGSMEFNDDSIVLIITVEDFEYLQDETFTFTTKSDVAFPFDRLLERRIDDAILEEYLGRYDDSGSNYKVSAHKTLKTVENDGMVTAYVMTAYAEYSNMGGSSVVSGVYGVPAAITIDKETLAVTEYLETPIGGIEEIKGKFPDEVWNEVDGLFYENYLSGECERKASNYFS